MCLLCASFVLFDSTVSYAFVFASRRSLPLFSFLFEKAIICLFGNVVVYSQSNDLKLYECTVELLPPV
jgi:hypothetical protein